MPWSRDKVVVKIHSASDQYSSINQQQYNQLVFALKRMPTEDAFEALYAVFLDTSRPQKRPLDQEYAGKLLLATTPLCTRPPLPIIKGILHNYDFSVEELPLYFAAMFGKNAVLRMLEGLISEELTPRERRSLETFVYWLFGPEKARALRSRAPTI